MAAAVQDKRNDIVTRRDITLPVENGNKLAFVLDNVYTEKECQDLIAITEERGYEQALVNMGGGRQKLMTDYRNSKRYIWDSVEKAEDMWSRIKQYVPEEFHGYHVVGLNERLRFLRYDPGEFFQPHMDGEYRRTNGERSFITVHLYLNQGFKGGSTTFLSFSSGQRVECVPKTGSILIFQHDICHEGSELLKGRKYTVRTDIMYKK